MKKLIFLLLLITGFIACENESIQELPQETSLSEDVNARKGDKVDVCHKGNVINVSINSLSAHQAHGDAVDMDGDGYFDIENECSEGIDCDDNNPDQFPGAEEEQFWYFIGDDNDQDGWVPFDDIFGDCRPSGYLNEQDAIAALADLGFPGLGDCDDENPNINPIAVEICDDVDDNCDGYLFDRSASATFDGNTIPAGFARFGSIGTVSGNWVEADEFCDPTGDDYSGKIVLIDRGLCRFDTKVLNAQNQGAIGVIICNTVDGLANMAGDPDLGITIPSIFLGLSDCELIKNSGVPSISFTVEDTCVESGDRMVNPEIKRITSTDIFDQFTGKFIKSKHTK